MPWSYTGNPADSDKDAVRYLIGDTDELEAFVSDEEILWELTNQSNIYAAAAAVAFNLSVKFATQAEQVKSGPIIEMYQNRSSRYAVMAKRLQSKADFKAGMTPVFTGTVRDSSFSIGMHDIADSDDSAGGKE